jgi:hypothetical protein
VFLPGFKANKLLDLPITAAAWDGGTVWRTPLRYPALSEQPVSTGTAWTSSDGHVLQLAFDLHEPRRSVRGMISHKVCQEALVVPPNAAQ